MNSSTLQQNALDRLMKCMEMQVDNGAVPGVIALVAREGFDTEVVVAGWHDLVKSQPMRRNTLFRIASMTKPITAVAALILMEEGHFGLDTPIGSWLPEFAESSVRAGPDAPLECAEKAERPITVLDLLTHRSGLGYAANVGGQLGEALAKFDLFAPETEVDHRLSELGALPLAYQPGTHFQYGLSSDVLGVLIKRVTGMPLHDFLTRRIFAPLGMTDTNFVVPTESKGRFPTAYRRGASGSLQVFDPPLDSRWSNPERFEGGGGGLVSTVDDYLRFGRMLLHQGELDGVRILTPGSVAMMTRDWLTPAQRQAEVFGRRFFAGQGYGLGVSVTDQPSHQAAQGLGHSSRGSFGWSGVYGTSWLTDPSKKMNVIYMSQVMDTDMTLSHFASVCAAAYEMESGGTKGPLGFAGSPGHAAGQEVGLSPDTS